MSPECIEKVLPDLPGRRAERRGAIDGVDCEVESIELVLHRHIERRCRGAFLVVPVDVKIIVIVTFVRQAMNERRIAVECENDRLVSREDRIEICIGEAVWMRRLRLQRHEIDHVDDADFQMRHVRAQGVDGGKRFERRHVAGARHHHVRFDTVVVARPGPDADALSTVANRGIDIEPLPFGLLSRDDDINVISLRRQ